VRIVRELMEIWLNEVCDNLIDLLPLTKRQCVQYLPKETPEAHQQYEELAKEMGVAAIGGGSPYKRCADFGILCMPQNLL